MKNKICFSLVVILFLGLGGCTKKSTGPDGDEPPKLTLFSTRGAPGTVIGASVDGMTLSPRSAFVVFDTVPAPIFATENDTFSFLVPLIPSGECKVFLKDSLGTTSTKVSFNVDKQPNTGKPPGQITTDMLSSTVELVDLVTSTEAKLTELGILKPSDSTVLSQDLNRITILLNSMQSDFAELPDSVKTMVDAFLYAAGISDILNTQNGGSSLGKCVRDLEMMLASSTPYDSFYVLVTLDNLSLVLSDLKAGLTISAVAILIATGGTGAAASGAIAAINFGISVLDNIIDGFLPSDLDRLQISFTPQSGPELNVGEKATVKVVGRFSSQKPPEDATVDIIVSGLFYAIEVGLAEHLEDVIEQLSLKLAQAMMVSLDDFLINTRRITLPHPVSVDIKYYEQNFHEMMTTTGMTALAPGVVVALDVVSLVLPGFDVVPLSFSTNVVSWNPGSNEISALSTGTLSENNVSPAAWACKPLCAGLGLASFICLGAEWPKVIEDNEHTVQAITIYEAIDETPPSAVGDLEVTTVTSNSATLEWTAPGDDGDTGTPSQYDIRYSTSTITSSNWNSATQCSGEPTPKSAGSSESFTVTNLNPNTTYYFAINTADEVSNWSGLSNVDSGKTSADGGQWATIFEDGFESYSAGQFPSSNWQPWHNCSSDPTNNIVTAAQAYSGNKSLQVYGAHDGGCWSATAVHLINSLPQKLHIGAYLLASGETGTGSCGDGDIYLGLNHQTEAATNYNFWNVGFREDMNVHLSIRGVGDELLQSYSLGQWYHVEIELDTSAETVTVWVDGTSYGPYSWSSGSLPYPLSEYRGVSIISNDGKGWGDDVTVKKWQQ